MLSWRVVLHLQVKESVYGCPTSYFPSLQPHFSLLPWVVNAISVLELFHGSSFLGVFQAITISFLLHLLMTHSISSIVACLILSCLFNQSNRVSEANKLMYMFSVPSWTGNFFNFCVKHLECDSGYFSPLPKYYHNSRWFKCPDRPPKWHHILSLFCQLHL